MTIGETIRQARERRRMRQEELAAKVGLSRQMVGHIEADRRRVSAEAAKAFSRALGISAKAIYAGPKPYGHWAREAGK